MKTIAVTGGSGFVGKRFLQYDKDRYHLRSIELRAVNPVHIDMNGVDTVVHLAGKAHQTKAVDDKLYFDVNFELTRALAVRAKEQGVAHFIYISSTKVYGDDIQTMLSEQSPCRPSDAYGASKLKAEEYLRAMASPGFAVSIIRPPLVYGPGVKGNMIRLLGLAAKHYPLPFGNIQNSRSIVFLDNLIELINAIIDKKPSGIFIAGDREPLPTSRLIMLIRKELGNCYPLLSIPQLLRVLLRRIKPGLHLRLFGSFVVDTTHTNKQLEFVPPFSTEEGIKKMVHWYLGNNKN